MNKRVIKNSLVALFILTMTIAKGQEDQITPVPVYGNHEYSAYLIGGLSGFSYSLSLNGEKSIGMGGGGGLSYTYNVSQSLGLSAGVEYSTFSGTASYKSLSEEYIGTDDNGDPVQYRYTLENFKEGQTLALFSIPVTALYKTPINPKMQFYGGGGFKFGFPVGAKSKIRAGKVTSSGYYDYENQTYPDVPTHGFFGGHEQGENTNTINAGFAAMLTLESGLRFIVGKTALYTGLYFDYSLNSIKKTNDKHPLNYDEKISYESVLNSSLANRMNLISVGVKVRFSLFLIEN